MHHKPGTISQVAASLGRSLWIFLPVAVIPVLLLAWAVAPSQAAQPLGDLQPKAVWAMLDELLEALVPDDAIEDCAALHAWMVKNPGAFETKAERSGVLVEMRMDVGICAVCREMIEAGLDDPGFRQRLAERSTASSYILRITARTDSGRDEAMDIVERLARKEVVEVAGTDTVSSAFVHVEALPGHTPYHSVLLGFDRPQGIGRQVIIENDATAQQWVLSFPHGAMEELVRLLPPGLIPATP